MVAEPDVTSYEVPLEVHPMQPILESEAIRANVYGSDAVADFERVKNCCSNSRPKHHQLSACAKVTRSISCRAGV
eukprot:6526429-Prymnesium_polylepis.2